MTLTDALKASLQSPLMRTTAAAPRIQGKVRDIYELDTRLALVTTDRVSAFDRVLGAVPLRGQALNQLSAWWLEETADIVGNHLIDSPDPNIALVHRADPLPVEVVVRGYITGVTDTSLWTLYAQGVERPYGLDLPSGLQKNDKLPYPVITPTTKAPSGEHDERLTQEQIIDEQWVEPKLWQQVKEVSLALFERGSAKAKEAGLILVDTKYEFGLIDGRLALIDEVHTPDCSRYWRDNQLQGEPQSMSKEHLRKWLKSVGYAGEGPVPAIPEEVLIDTALRYIEVFERLTATAFVPASQPAQPRIEGALTDLLAQNAGVGNG